MRERMMMSNLARISPVRTPYGDVMVVNRIDTGGVGTIVGGFYSSGLLGKKLYRGRGDITLEGTEIIGTYVQTVPKEEQLEIAGILKKNGYKEPIRFWS